MALVDRINGERQKVAITIQDNPTEILEFDATVSETHTGNAETTDHPVENGADLTDHIRRTPEELQITGVVTDTPLVILASERAEPSIPGGDPVNRSQDAYGWIKAVKDAGQLCAITTKLRDYVNMALVGLSVPRDKERSRVAEMSLMFREIVIATTEQVEAPEPAEDKKSRKNRTKQGKKTKGPETAANQASSSSILSDAFSAFGG